MLIERRGFDDIGRVLLDKLKIEEDSDGSGGVGESRGKEETKTSEHGW